MNLIISQNIFNSNYRNTVKKENQKKSNQINAISKNQSFQVCSKQASQALKNNISFGAPQIPSIGFMEDSCGIIEGIYTNLISNSAYIRPATVRIQNQYKQELTKNLRNLRNSNYDKMSIVNNVLDNPEFLSSNNFAKKTNEDGSFLIYVYPKGDNRFVKGVKIGENGQRLKNVGFVCYDFVDDDGVDILNSYSIKAKEGYYLSNLKVKLKKEDPEREYDVRKVTDLNYIDFLDDLDEYGKNYSLNRLIATNERDEWGTLNINGINLGSIDIDNNLTALLENKKNNKFDKFNK